MSITSGYRSAREKRNERRNERGGTIIRIGARKMIYGRNIVVRPRYEKRHERATARGTNEGQFTGR